MSCPCGAGGRGTEGDVCWWLRDPPHRCQVRRRIHIRHQRHGGHQVTLSLGCGYGRIWKFRPDLSFPCLILKTQSDWPIFSTAFYIARLCAPFPGNEKRRIKVVCPSVRLPLHFRDYDWLIYQATSGGGERWLAHLFDCLLHFLILIDWFTNQRVN